MIMDALASFPAGFRICFFGDSITAGGLWIRDITDYFLDACPKRRILPINSGVPGDSASGALRRIHADCTVWFPQVVVVMFGMNDVGRELYGRTADRALLEQREQRLRDYAAAMHRIVQELQAAGSMVVLCTPTPYDEWGTAQAPVLTGCDGALESCAQTVRALAEERNCMLVDFHQAFLTRMQEEQDWPAVGPDRVHPTPVGHRFMAEVFLRRMGLLTGEEAFDPRQHKKNQQRFALEETLRNLSFADWCLNGDVRDSWDEAVGRINENLAAADAWNDAYISRTIRLYRENKINLDILRGELARLTLAMYTDETEESA